MLIINPTIAVNFQSQIKVKPAVQVSNKTQNSNQAVKLGLTLAGLATVAAGTIWLKKNSFTNFNKTLEKNGLELRKNIAYIKGTDKKFTGSIKRNSKSFGREKEITSYVDGVISEKLWYDFRGREMEGNFYKNGKLFRSVHSANCYRGCDFVGYTEIGEEVKYGKLRHDASIFEEMRKDVPDYIELKVEKNKQ